MKYRKYLFSFIFLFCSVFINHSIAQQKIEITIVQNLFRLRNEHKADSAELYYADTVLVYMKYLRNIPRNKITQSDKAFWKAHPKNKFEIVAPLQLSMFGGVATVIIFGKEYLDGTTFKYEKIEIKFDRKKKINSYRGFNWRKK